MGIFPPLPTTTIPSGQIPTHDLSKLCLSVPVIVYGWKVCESVVELVKLFKIVYTVLVIFEYVLIRLSMG